MSDRQIRTWRTWYRMDEDIDQALKQIEDLWLCEPDDIDREEATSAVGIAVAVLVERLYVQGASSYPGFQVGMWYSRTDEPDQLAPDGATHEELTAHLEGFSPDEQRAVFDRLVEQKALVGY